MTDIVERLLALDGIWHDGIWGEAAADIKRLRSDFESGMERFYSQMAELDNAKAENERLKEVINRQATVIEQTDRLAYQCGQMLAAAKLEIAKLQTDLRDMGILR